jgi:hypothetical protein
METKTRSCHACGGPVAAKGPTPRDGLSTCGPCREKGVDPRDVEKTQMFDAWVKAEIIPDPEARLRVADLWGAYLSWITLRDADYYYGKNRFVERLESVHGHEDHTRRVRWYVGVRTVTPMI